MNEIESIDRTVKVSWWDKLVNWWKWGRHKTVVIGFDRDPQPWCDSYVNKMEDN